MVSSHCLAYYGSLGIPPLECDTTPEIRFLYKLLLHLYAHVTLAPMMATAVAEVFKTVDAPDFYWKFRLDRLASKKGSDLAFNAKNYPTATNDQELYESYYLDLTLQGKMAGFDWMAEKEMSDSEWLTIYKNICEWSVSATKTYKPNEATIPSSDFDLLRAVFPQIDYRELEATWGDGEMPANFPYKNLKTMLDDAIAGKLNIPGYDAKSITSINASSARKKLAALKESTMNRIDAAYEKCVNYAKIPFPDAESKAHYQELRATLSQFPQTKQEWDVYRANFEREMDEMAAFAARQDEEEEHHHEEEDESHGHAKKMSVAEEFQQKYGWNLEEISEKMIAFKADPEGFLEASIMENYGKAGLDIWKKSQEFSAKMDVMTEAEKQSTEKAFADFLKSA